MTQFKHTPGPWMVFDKTEIVTTNGVVVASSSWMRNEEEEIPNARLIAAAPELLEALRSIPQRYLDDMDAHTPKAAQMIRAAIAKATGSSHDRPRIIGEGCEGGWCKNMV